MRAATTASTTSASSEKEGAPAVAQSNDSSANGSANTECDNFTSDGHKLVRNAEPVEDLAHDEIDELGDGRWAVVEPRHRRQHDHPEARELEHVLEMQHGQWRLPRHDDERPALLDRHIGSAFDEVAREAVRHAREGAHAARHDDYSHDAGAARSRRGFDGLERVHAQAFAQWHRKQRREIWCIERDLRPRLVNEHAQRGPRRTQVDFVA